MSDVPYLGQNIDSTLGQEFLTWLWFRSESTGGTFVTSKGSAFSLSMEQRISVQGGEGDTLETATVSGSLSPLREGRLGIATGKKVTRALLRLEKDADAWQVTLKAEDLCLNSLRTPKVERSESDGDLDADALFLEKIYLIETALELVDELYKQFMEVRLNTSAWKEECAYLRQWIKKSQQI